MRFPLTILLIALTSFVYSQDMKVKWEDNDGREFSITAPSGSFSYGMISGDNVTYDFKNRVSRVGSVSIQYDYKGRVTRVGSVNIQYDYKERVTRVGGLIVTYDYKGRVTKTSGSVTR